MNVSNETAARPGIAQALAAVQVLDPNTPSSEILRHNTSTSAPYSQAVGRSLSLALSLCPAVLLSRALAFSRSRTLALEGSG